jgi:hypothetical protein
MMIDIKRNAIVLVCLLLVGCSSPTVYQLAVSSDGEGVRRELTVSNGGEFEEMLRTIYGEGVVEDEGVLRYSSTFDAVPQDVGGSGTWRRVTSPMGSVYFYAERFRGDDDLLGQVEARLLATDRVTDLLIAWFESEMGEDARWPGLRGFMDTQMRRDMKNLSLYVLELKREGVEDEVWGPVYMARVGQYLIDRDYVEKDDLVEVMRTFLPSREEEPDDLLQRVVARRMGIGDGEDIPGALGFLGLSEIEAGDSWAAFSESPAFTELVGGWDLPESVEVPGEGDLENVVLMTGLSAAGIEFEIFSSPDEVHLSLACGSEPVATNGQWDAEAGVVRWEGLVRERYGLPLFFYACWGEADADYQAAHFGRVLFEGEVLAEVVMWYTGLSDESRARWDGFVESLDPGGDLLEQVEAAREGWGEAGDDPLGRGYGWLVNALEEVGEDL